MKIVDVEATIKLTVAVPDDYSKEMILFVIEEEGCPGTGLVGRKLKQLIEDSNVTQYCWACPDGHNKVLAIDGIPIKENEYDRSYQTN